MENILGREVEAKCIRSEPLGSEIECLKRGTLRQDYEMLTMVNAALSTCFAPNAPDIICPCTLKAILLNQSLHLY